MRSSHREHAAALGALVRRGRGSAPAALAGLPRPDRVFVGGGGLDVLYACLAAAAPAARWCEFAASTGRSRPAAAGAAGAVSVDRASDLPDGGVRFVADNPVFVAWGDAPQPRCRANAPTGRSPQASSGSSAGPGRGAASDPGGGAAVRGADVVVGYGPYVDAARSLCGRGRRWCARP